MKVKTFFLLAAVLLMTASASFGVTGVKMKLEDITFTLRVSCDPNADPIPTNPNPGDPTKGMVWIYRDWNQDGPNVPCSNTDWWQNNYTPGGIIQLTTTVAGDTLIPKYTGTCSGAKATQFPINSFPMDNDLVSEPLGYFLGGSYINSCSNYNAPAVDRFFCVVTYSDANGNRVMWISNSFSTGNDNANHVINIPDWCCVYKSACVTPDPVYFTPVAGRTQNQGACVTICKDHSETVCVGPVPLQDRIPHVTVLAGCNHTPFCVNTTCTPAVGFVWDATPWVWTVNPAGHPAGNYYCKTITWDAGNANRASGCVCVEFDVIEPVGMGEVAILPLDNSVKITWNTLSETNLDKWIVKRDNVAVYQVNATNSTSGHNYEFTDESAVNGRTYNYSLVMRNSDGSEEVVRTLSATPSADNAIVTEYALRQNYPNPFNPNTKISYDVLNTNLVTLKIYNAAGQEVTTLVNEVKTGGKRYSVNFDATNLPSGLYFYNIRIGSDFSATKKMLLVK